MTPDGGLLTALDERYQTEESVRLLQQDAPYHGEVSIESFQRRLVPTEFDAASRRQWDVSIRSLLHSTLQPPHAHLPIEDSEHANLWHALRAAIESPRMEAEDDWLADAIAELGRIDHYIRSDGLPDVGQHARDEAQRLLEDLRLQPLAPVIYPSEGDLVIHFKAPSAPASVVIEVSDDGRAVCYAHMHGKSRRASYDTSTDLPDVFLWDQMHKLTNLV